MKQSRMASIVETAGSTATGFVLSLGIQNGVNWYYDLPLAQHQSVAIIGVFTVASLLRGYWWRRLMERVGVRVKLSAFAQAVLAERARQQAVEGFDIAHDDTHRPGELAEAGAAYLLDAGMPRLAPRCWPWSDEWWKPQATRRDLVRGCALGLAEGEKFDRMRRRGRAGARPPVQAVYPTAATATPTKAGERA